MQQPIPAALQRAPDTRTLLAFSAGTCPCAATGAGRSCQPRSRRLPQPVATCSVGVSSQYSVQMLLQGWAGVVASYLQRSHCAH
jgi:hypothetical protein